jgi:hypothetical protein
MYRILCTSLVLVTVIVISACSKSKEPATTGSTPPAATPQSQARAQPQATTGTTTSTAVSGDLQVGQASGTYTAKGELVELKYAYAGRGERFGNQAIIVLVTDQPIPAEAVAEEIKDQSMLLNEKIKGLEYVFMDDESLWVRFHPGQYQESTHLNLKEYKVEGDVVRGVDDNKGDLTNGRYARNVRFVAAVMK